MSLNLNEKTQTTSSVYNTSPSYVDAVNDAQFVRTFGILAGVLGLLSPIVLFLFWLSRAAAIGIGVAVMRFGNTKYYRILGIVVCILGFVFMPLALLVLSLGIGIKGILVLSTLSSEGKGDPDWLTARNQALTGVIASALGIVLGTVGLVLYVIGISILGGSL